MSKINFHSVISKIKKEAEERFAKIECPALAKVSVSGEYRAAADIMIFQLLINFDGSDFGSTQIYSTMELESSSWKSLENIESEIVGSISDDLEAGLFRLIESINWSISRS